MSRAGDLVAEAVASGRFAFTFLVTTCLVILVIEGLPVPLVVSDVGYSLISFAIVLAIVVGVQLHRPRAARAWYLMAAGQTLWATGDLVFIVQEDVLGRDPFPSIADAFYLLGYPVIAVGLAFLVRGRSGTRRDPGPLLDSATVTAGLCLLSWVLLQRPTIESLHQSVGSAAVSAAYPAMDILLVGALVRLVSSPGGRSTSFRFLLLSLMALITADTMSVAFDLYGTNDFAAVDYLWLFSYAAWGAAALHPSMTRLSDPITHPDVRFGGLRLVAVVLATLIAPAILAVHQITGVSVDIWAVIIGSVVMFLLVVVRMNLALEQIVAVHEALETLQDELAVQATQDALTGLANRTQSMRLLAGALGRSRRRGTNVGLLFIDLDGFKNVNDEHGHQAGDAVLREVAWRMAQEVREGDFLGRLGGDEFVVGIEDVTDEEAAVTLATRLIESVSREIPVDEVLDVRVGASIGIALGRGGETDVETLLHEADLAVYQAKAGGRGHAVVFGQEAREAERVRMSTERALVEGIGRGELVLHYQPVVNLRTGVVAGYEALVRWDRPDVGLLHPAQFLDVAESSDVICDLDAWVLRTAVAQLEQWNAERGERDLQIAVNVSGRHISRDRIRRDVAQALTDRAVDPGQLVLEVTETALMDGSVAAANLEVLRELGVVVSLDDFGTGYQSSTQLVRLPVDLLKIDKHFVDASTKTGRTLLELMVKAAHAFGVEVVAEGVEHQEQLDLVRRLGCEFAQGYFLGMPVPADQVHQFEEAEPGLVGKADLAG